MGKDDPSTAKSLDDPETALIAAFLYQELGGIFWITSEGSRVFGRNELNHRDESRIRATNVVERILARLSGADADLVYDCFATADVDQSKLLPSIEEPTRAQ